MHCLDSVKSVEKGGGTAEPTEPTDRSASVNEALKHGCNLLLGKAEGEVAEKASVRTV